MSAIPGMVATLISMRNAGQNTSNPAKKHEIDPIDYILPKAGEEERYNEYAVLHFIEANPPQPRRKFQKLRRIFHHDDV